MPKYTQLFRETEKKICGFLTDIGFKECLFPKLPTASQCVELKKALPRLSEEWSKELVDAKLEQDIPSYPKEFTLSHWQCEPFYYYLKREKPQEPVRFFDRSGWSYRVETDIDDFRLFEFQRIECVWTCPCDGTETLLNGLLEGLSHILGNMGLENRIVRKIEEEKSTNEKIVRDIEVELKGVGIVELVGCHVHGRLFVDGLRIDIPENFYTGCCGIGLNRIVNCLIKLGLS